MLRCALACAVLAPFDAQAQACDRYLNASDGDDSNSGTEPQNPVRSFEHAFLSFPSESVVCIAAGEYIHGPDSDGVQLSGPAGRAKSMRFVVHAFAESDEVAFTEDEFRLDIGSGTLSFETGTADRVRLGVGVVNHPDAFPSNTTFLHTLALSSGTIDARGVSLSIGPSVGNPDFSRDGKAAPGSASIVRGLGRLLADSPFRTSPTAARRLIYRGAGDRQAGAETPPLIGRLVFEHTSGSVALDREFAFADGGSVELRAAGSAALLVPLSIDGIASPAVTVSGSGRLSFAAELVIGLAASTGTVVRVVDDGSLSMDDVRIEAGPGSEGAEFAHSGTGTLDIGRLAAAPGVLVLNTGSGHVSLGSATSESVVAASIVNESDGTLELVGTLLLDGDVTNLGSLDVTGPASVTGSFDNAGEVHLDADLDVAGTFANSGSIDLQARTLKLSGPNGAVNSGSIDGLEKGSGWLALDGDLVLTGDGRLTNVRSLSGEHHLDTDVIDGDLVAEGGSITMPGLSRIGGSVRVHDGEIALPGTHIEGSLVSNGGVVRLEASSTIEGDVRVEGDGAVHLGAIELTLHGDLIRETGTLLADDAVLRMVGPSQTLRAGPSARIGTLQISGAEVVLDAFALDVIEMLLVDSSAQLHLGGQEIRLPASGAAAAIDGTITSNPNGGLVLGASSQSLSGTGRLANVEIAATDEHGLVSVVDADLRQDGILTLTRGQLQVDDGSSYTLIGTSLLRRNVGDADENGVRDAPPVRANAPSLGSFTASDSGYSLEYFGRVDGRVQAAPEIVPSSIVDLRILIEGPGGDAATLELQRDESFRGNLEIRAGAVLDIGPYELRALGDGGAHWIAGSLAAGSGAFVVHGGRVTGAEAGESVVENLTVRAGEASSIRDLKSIGGMLLIEEGSVTLHLQQDGEGAHLAAGNVVGLRLTGSANLMLESSIHIGTTFFADGGAVDFGTYDIVVGNEGSFQLEGMVAMQSTGGRVVFPGAGTLATGEGAIPRLLIAAETGVRTELTGRTAVSASFAHRGGVLDLGTSDLVLDGSAWIDAGGSYDGSGRIVVTGDVAASFVADVTVPNLTLAGPSEETSCTVRSAMSEPVVLTVREALQLTGGTIDMSDNHLASRGVLSYQRGAIRSSGDGALVLDGARVELADSFKVATLRIAGTSDLSASMHPLTVERRVLFHADSLTGVAPSNVHLADGSTVVRYGAGTFDDTPSFGEVVHLEYDFRAVTDSSASFQTGGEVSPHRIGRLTVDAGASSLALASETSLQEGLVLRSGRLRTADHLVIEGGGSVHLLHLDGLHSRLEEGSFRTAGPITLVFESTREDVTSSELTFPSGANVDSLIVRMGDALEHEDLRFTLHDDRSIGSLILDHRTAGSTMDVNGRTLTVHDDVRLLNGILTSTTDAGVQVQGDLDVRPSSRVAGRIAMRVGGQSIIAGVFGASRLTAFGDVLVSGSLGGPGGAPTIASGPYQAGVPTLAFAGTGQHLRLEGGDDDPSSIDESVNRLILDLSEPTGVVYIDTNGSPLTVAVNHLVLERGILSTGLNDVRLPHDGSGIERDDHAISHVAGRISRELQAGQPHPGTAAAARFEFPLGTTGPAPLYRPFRLDFTPEMPVPAATVVTVEHAARRPAGYRGLPVDGGAGVLIDDVAEMAWTLQAHPAPPNGLRMRVGAFAAGLDAFSEARALRFVFREAPAGDERWSLAGSAGAYDNTVVQIGAVTAPYIQLLEQTLAADEDGVVFAPGVENVEIDYARVQFANLLERDITFIVDDSVRHAVPSGESTEYLRTDGVPSVVSLQLDERTVAYDSVHFEAGMDYFAAAVYGESANNRRLIVFSAAAATPQVQHRDAVSVGFVNALPGTGPLTLRKRDEGRSLLEDVPYATHSQAFAVLPPEDAEFSMTTGADRHELDAVRSSLHEAEGLTVLAVAHPVLEQTSFASQLTLIDSEGDVLPSNVHVTRDEPPVLPGSFRVHGNYPNPFNPTTRIRFDLPDAALVSVAVYDLLGRRVHVVPRRVVEAGVDRTVEIDASRLASGTYLYRVSAETPAATLSGTGRMTLVR